MPIQFEIEAFLLAMVKPDKGIRAFGHPIPFGQ